MEIGTIAYGEDNFCNDPDECIDGTMGSITLGTIPYGKIRKWPFCPFLEKRRFRIRFNCTPFHLF